MNKLVCFKHPEYVGNESPVLSCKACCSIFIAEIKNQNNAHVEASKAKATARFDTKKWLEEKAKEARQAILNQANSRINLNGL